MQPLAGFDPIIFLGIEHVSEEEKPKLNYELLEQISEYLFIRTVELLGDESLSSAKSLEQVFAVAYKKVPDYRKRVKIFLEDFKREFNRGK